MHRVQCALGKLKWLSFFVEKSKNMFGLKVELCQQFYVFVICKLFYALAFFAAAITATAAVAAFVAIIIVNVFFLFHLTFNVLIHDKQSPTFCVLELFRFQCVCSYCMCMQL